MPKNKRSKEERYASNRDADAMSFVRKAMMLHGDFEDQSSKLQAAIINEIEMAMAEAIDGNEFGYNSNLYEYDLLRGLLNAVAKQDARNDDELRERWEGVTAK